MRITARELFVVLVLTVAGAACTTTSTGTAKPDGGSCGGFMFITSTCQTCFDTSCCSEGAACEANAACAQLDSCVLNCATGDTACEQSCSAANPSGQADFDAVASCVNSGPCSSACSTSQVDAGAPAQCGGYSSTNPCLETCFTGSCCTQGTSCGNTDCLELFNCVKACPANSSSCVQTCESAHSASVTDYQNLINCIGASCSGCSPPDGGGGG